MSRIKGTYQLKCDGSTVVRWLDPTNGKCYKDEWVTTSAVPLFKLQPNGSWVSEWGYIWLPDPPSVADWYVMKDKAFTPPAHFTNAKPVRSVFGPYTEQEARASALYKAERFGGAWSVLQLCVGNTVQVVPPTPPKAEVVWS